MVKIYSVKPTFKLARVGNVISTPPILGDEILDLNEDPNLVVMADRGKNIDTSLRYSGDFSKIENVYFIKGATFDRDYFRRLYPNINVRIKPELADVIIYDEKSVFENDVSPAYYYTVKKDNDVIYFTPNNTLGCIKNAAYNKMSYENRLYGDIKVKKDTVLECFMLNYGTASFSSAYLGTSTHYINMLNGLKKAYVHVNDILNKIPSSLKQNNLSLQECISYLNQIKSGNSPAMKAAYEAIVMYNHDKYLPIQIMFSMLYKYNVAKATGSNNVPVKSNKITIFEESYKNFFAHYNPSQLNFLSFLDYFSKICGNNKGSFSTLADWGLTRDLLHADELFKSIPSIAGNSFSYVVIEGVNFNFTNSPLEHKVEPVVKENASISEFTL
jgi:hypothetical protein